MMEEFLTEDELTTLTGATRNSGRVGWLRTHNWNFVENSKGFPVVSRLYCRQRLSGETPSAPVYPAQPNFEALLA